MPTYEYLCKCGNEFEEFQSIKAPSVAKCPACGKKATRQISAGVGLIFKGTGFYITDYKNKNASPSSNEANSSEKPSESKTTDKPVSSESKPTEKTASSDKTTGSSEKSPSASESKPAAKPNSGNKSTSPARQ